MSTETEIYEELKSRCADIDRDVTMHRHDMALLNSMWFTVSAVIRERDAALVKLERYDR